MRKDCRRLFFATDSLLYLNQQIQHNCNRSYNKTYFQPWGFVPQGYIMLSGFYICTHVSDVSADKFLLVAINIDGPAFAIWKIVSNDV